MHTCSKHLLSLPPVPDIYGLTRFSFSLSSPTFRPLANRSLQPPKHFRLHDFLGATINKLERCVNKYTPREIEFFFVFCFFIFLFFLIIASIFASRKR